MATSFSISRSRAAGLSDGDLQREIHSYTGSESETDSILRSMGRFGDDETIRSYEMIPRAKRPGQGTVPSSAWTVRALR